MKTLTATALFLSLTITLFASNIYEKVENRIVDYLEKDPQIQAHYKLDLTSLSTYTSLQAKERNEAEAVHFFNDPSQETLIFPAPKLKIAIDPGHLGGDMACFEERYIDLTVDGQRVQFDEGTLTFLTALHLKELLEKDGFEVMMTRDAIGKGALTQDFFSWLGSHPQKEPKLPLAQLFRSQYNLLDLNRRAVKINEFHPDATVIIHFNAHDSEKSPFSLTNFNMCFIPGAFCKCELSTKESRSAFMRLAVTDDLENSRLLSKSVLHQFVNILEVPAVSESEKINYLENCSLFIEPGLYSRNLALTRQVKGVLCYGESLVQNHKEEALRLSKKDTEIGGIPCSSRLKQVADCYYLGLKEYFQGRMKIQSASTLDLRD